MNFVRRPIRKEIPKPKPVKKKTEEVKTSTTNPNTTKFAIILGSLVLISIFAFGIIQFVKSIDLSSVVLSNLGKKLQVNENGNTNILLVGVGGEGHDGANLTDTIILASINYDQKAIAMLSIPRDLHIKNEDFPGGTKINGVYALSKDKNNPLQSRENLIKVVSEITGQDIHYFIKIDFQGFVKIVDSLGGVEVMVEKDIYDTQYPVEETRGYQTFSLKKGLQPLDGETALKYARSRHGKGNEEMDFSRAKRQQDLLFAIKEKALSLQILTNPAKIQKLYESINESLETDMNLQEMIELARIAKDFGKESIVSRVLTNNNFNCGGYLYTPPIELYRASVLIPAGKDYDLIHAFTKDLFEKPLLVNDQSKIQVLNGTKTPYVAGEVFEYLSRLCLNTIYYSNAENRDLAVSTIYYTPTENGEKPPLLSYLIELMPIAMNIKAGIPEAYLNNEKKEGTAFVIELGADYLQNRIKDPFKNIILPAAKPNPTPSPASVTSDSTDEAPTSDNPIPTTLEPVNPNESGAETPNTNSPSENTESAQ